VTSNRQADRRKASAVGAAWRRRLRGGPLPGDAVTAALVDAAVSADAAISSVWETVPGAVRLPTGTGAEVSRRRDAVFRRMLGLADVVAAYLALVFAVSVLGGAMPRLRPTIILLAPLVVLASKTIGLYDRDQHTLRKTTIDEVPSILHVSVFYALAVWLLEALLFHGWLSRPQVLGLAVATFGLVTGARAMVRAIALAITPAERCLVLGNAADAERTAARLAGARGVNAIVLGRLALRADDLHDPRGSVTLGDLQSLARVIAEHDVERVIIAPDSHDQEEILTAIRLVKALEVKVSVLPRLLEVVGSSSTFDEVGGITLLGVRQYGMTMSSALLKRLMDIVAATIGLVLLAPLLLMLGLAVKLDSRGPVLFRQPRIGRRGERFDMFKFRSMVPDAERIKRELHHRNEAEGGLFKITDDPRVTRVGRWLRQAALDELPQLFNVLKGEMSLVGPRPLVPDEDQLIEGWQRQRLAVKPGMTGLWQIFGSSRIPMNEMVKIDYLYGANWSIWLDLKILLRTIAYMVQRRGL
jgi:exopolysaccharide biosynthesis polyprenyl glycosylphosphotransferase